MHQGSVLIVEDDGALRHSLKVMFRAQQFQVDEVSSGELALSQVRARKPEVVLLDLNMPGLGGLATCTKLRSMEPGLPILVLSARDREEDVVSALNAGADDYITKPFRLPELTARMRSAVRRSRQSSETSHEHVLEVGPFHLDTVAHRVDRNGEEVRLTPKEFKLLHVFMRNAERALSHHYLLAHVWGPEYGDEREYLRTYINQLRKKLEEDPTRPRFLTTEVGIGYKFRGCLPA